MKPSDDIFQLIQSLSQAEKRYFKIFASKHVIGEKNNYVRLFEAINAQEAYDESSIKEQFKDETFIQRLSWAKNHLYNLIMRSMRAFREEKTPRRKVLEILENAEILIEKRLFRQAKSQMAKAKKLAYKYDYFGELLRILAIERYRIHDGETRNIERLVEETTNERADVIRMIENIHQYDRLYDLFFTQIRANVNKEGAEVKDQIDTLYQNEYLQNEDRALSFLAKLRFFSINALYSFLKKDNLNAYDYRCKLVDLWESHPHRIEDEPLRYVTALGNLITICLNSKYFDEYSRHIKKLKNLQSVSLEMDAELFQNIYYLEIQYYSILGQVEKGLKLVPEIEAGLLHFADKINKAREIAICFAVAWFYLITGALNKSQNWLERIIDDRRVENRQDTQDSAHLILLLIHYELGNHSLLEHTIRSMERQFTLKKRLLGVEAVTFKFFRRILSAVEKQETKKEFYDWGFEIEKLMNDPKEKHNLALSIFSIWLESKIEDKTVREVYDEKFALSSQDA